MHESEMKDVLKHEGWTPNYRKRNQGTRYLYAARRRSGKLVERYIAPVSKFGDLTQEQVLAKLK